MSDLKQRYMKERRRVQSAINRAKKEGYQVGIKIPDIPKRITEGSIRRLKTKFSTKVVNESSTRLSQTGKTIPRSRDIIKRRQSRMLKPEPKVQTKQEPQVLQVSHGDSMKFEVSTAEVWEQDFIIESFIQSVQGIAITPNGMRCVKLIEDWVRRQVDKYGKNAVARALSDADFDAEILYDAGGKRQQWYTNMRNLMASMQEEDTTVLDAMDTAYQDAESFIGDIEEFF